MVWEPTVPSPFFYRGQPRPAAEKKSCCRKSGVHWPAGGAWGEAGGAGGGEEDDQQQQRTELSHIRLQPHRPLRPRASRGEISGPGGRGRAREGDSRDRGFLFQCNLQGDFSLPRQFLCWDTCMMEQFLSYVLIFKIFRARYHLLLLHAKTGYGIDWFILSFYRENRYGVL